MMWKTILAGLTLSLAMSAAAADNSTLNPSSLLFVMGNEWLQFEGDEQDGIFRIYAAAIDESGETKDFPNLFFFNCGNDYRYLTIHLPAYYAFQQFDHSIWIPETTVFARDFSGTYKFDAELNKNEFHLDFDGGIFGSLAQILSGKSAEFRLGPAMECQSAPNIDPRSASKIDPWIRANG